jgi:hypothetical protein
MLSVIMLSIVVLSDNMLSIIIAEFNDSEYCCAE